MDKRVKRSPLAILKDKTGSALLMALATSMILMILATEIMYQTTVEAQVSSQSVNQLKAYYAAKAATELGLFRVYLFRKAVAQFGDALPDKSLLDMIWNFPFAWPPQLPDEIGMIGKEAVDKTVKASHMQAKYTLWIESEGSKIDINDLASASKVVADSVREQIIQIFQSQMEYDEAFADKYRNFDFNKLINNITDWVDENNEALGGGDEKSLYRDYNSEDIPPNQPLKTVGELHMVSEMTDDLFNLLAPRITVFGTKGVNINYAKKEVLQSLHRNITPEIADKIVAARTDPARGPFKNLQDFASFMESLGVPAATFIENDQAKVPIIFDAEYNFRITGVGISGKVERKITAITYDFDSVKDRLSELLKIQADKEKGAAGAADGTTPQPVTPPSGQPPGATPKPAEKKKIKVPKERPTVVYWGET